MSTAVGRWKGWHESVKPFGDTASYAMGAAWLEPCELVEDWGAGSAWLTEFIEPERYRGVDGSPGPATDEIADLTEYRSEVPGIFIRHVLEHNHEWQKILDNALASFTERMFLVLFTKPGSVTRDVEFEDPPGVPNISFRLGDLTERMDAAGVDYNHESLGNSIPFGLQEPKQIGTETIFRISR